MGLYHEDIGQGEVVLLLHGFTGFSGDWLPLLDHLPDRFRYIMPDFPGHGQSPSQGDVYTHKAAAEAVFRLLDDLGIERFQACGMSGGAMTLLHMATLHPSRIEAMILVSPTTHYTDQARVIMGAVDPDEMPEQEWETMRKRHPLGDKQIRELWRHSKAFKDDFSDMNFQPQDLEQIEALTFIVHGDCDPLIPLEIAETIKTHITSSSLWTIPGGGHIPVFGEEFLEFFSRTSQFLIRNRSGVEQGVAPNT